MKIAIDAMGNDKGCPPIISGVAQFLNDAAVNDAVVVLVGNRDLIAPELTKNGLAENARLEIFHCAEVVEMGDKFEAVRKKKDSSIVRAVELAKEGKVDAIVALGNTVAAVGAATLGLRHIKGVSRAGLAVTLPSGDTGKCLCCDMGSNVNAKPEHLADYALMGSIYAEKIWRVARPRVGLLNVGEERGKGNAVLNETFALIEKTPVHFLGNVEGRDLWNGNCDVVICDGFIGNALLKSTEGVLRAMNGWIKYGVNESGFFAKFGAFLMKKFGAFNYAKRRGDPDYYGGMPLLGVNGICMIGHGGSKPLGVYHALKNARDAALCDINAVIAENVAKLREADE
ncbi:MAG: phosphate acyltransferase PlsX [Planctomycetota bacterium]|jgi:glycerol-3-phosphate acyltransferase PlsX|nr:phosphate acyltransferase PlsX [Planctomycetota bacterium]